MKKDKLTKKKCVRLLSKNVAGVGGREYAEIEAEDPDQDSEEDLEDKGGGNITKKGFQINIIDSDLEKIKKFEKEAGKKYSQDVLTGFVHVKTRDGKFMHQSFFESEEPCNECFKFTKSFNFFKVNQEEIDPLDLLSDGIVKTIWSGGFIEEDEE